MEFLASLLVFMLCGSAHSATITLSAVTSPVTEGTNVAVQCTIPSTETREVVAVLAIDPSSTAENGFDVDLIQDYQCEIEAGQTSGTVNIPTIADAVTETTTDTLVITGTALDGADTVTGTATFVINDDGLGSAPVLRIRRGAYRTTEGDGDIDLIVELVDSNGDPVPFEDDDTIGFLFTDDTATGGLDYDNTVTPNIFGSTMGIPTTQTLVTIPVTNDFLPENVEVFEVSLDPAVPTTISVNTMSSERLFIHDNDKPQIFVLNSDSVLPRRSRRAVTQYAFTVNANDGITWESGPYTLCESTETNSDIPDTNGIKLKISRPKSRTRTRFNWFSFATTETTPGGNFDLFTTTSISATGRTGRAPINVISCSTVTVCPASLDPADTNLGNEETIYLMGGRGSSTIRWSVYRNPGNPIERRLPDYNGKLSLTISTINDIGVYKIFRRNRGVRGWVQYVSVIPSECPCGYYHNTGFCDGGPIECEHGGFVDPSFNQGICTCPPGYMGRTCELLAPGPGQFGNNAEYEISDFFPGKTNGRGITFSFAYPFGSTCAPGFHGPGCWKRCPDGFFGSKCIGVCHCVDDVCDLNGRCPNGCAAGFRGPTCQTEM